MIRGTLRWTIRATLAGLMVMVAFAALVIAEPIGQGYLPGPPVARPRNLAPSPEWLALATPVASLAYELGWRGSDLVTFVAIVGAESNYNPAALGDNYPIRDLLCPSHGLAQIRSCPGTPKGLDRGPRLTLVDPRGNLAVAWRLWNSWLGRIHWSTWTNGRFRDYLPIAIAATEGLR